MKHLLLTKEIVEHLLKLYSTRNIKIKDKVVICKFFTPWSLWAWYVFEGEQQEDNDYLFFGMVHGFEKKRDYFWLSQLTEVEGPRGLKIERDASVFKQPYRSLIK